MHPIKFRAYIKSLQWLLPVERICFDCGTVEIDLTGGNGDTAEYGFDEVELLQYSGLNDKNGMEIYNGYIVRAWKHNETPFVYEITHRNGVFWFGNWNWIEFQNIFRNIEVIGNKFENPELLGGL